MIKKSETEKRSHLSSTRILPNSTKSVPKNSLSTKSKTKMNIYCKSLLHRLIQKTKICWMPQNQTPNLKISYLEPFSSMTVHMLRMPKFEKSKRKGPDLWVVSWIISIRRFKILRPRSSKPVICGNLKGKSRLSSKILASICMKSTIFRKSTSKKELQKRFKEPECFK